jgi:hypothetical protein
MRLACLTVVNTFAVLGLLLVSDRDKDTEILVLRHQVGVLERQLGGKKVRFTPADRALLAALLRRLRPQTLGRMRLLVRPGTVLRSLRLDQEAARCPVHARAAGAAPHGAFGPRPGASPGSGESRVGVPARAW